MGHSMPGLVGFGQVLDPIKKYLFLKFNNLKLFELIGNLRLKT